MPQQSTSISDTPVERSQNKFRRQLQTLSLCNNVFFQAQTEHELLQSFCETLAAGNNLQLAWIGYCESAREFIRPVAKAGVGADYFDCLEFSEDTGKGELSPVDLAFRS